MNFHTQHPMQPFWNLAGAAIQAQALELALEFKLFEHLSLPADADLVALQLNMPAPAATVWLDLLWSMGLLELATGDTRRYRSSDLAQQYFVAASAQSCAASWRYRRQALRGFADQMAGLLGQEGSTVGRGKMGSWAQAAREQISQEQKAVSVPAVLRQLQRWGGLPAEGRFLDLGCGPGHVGIALAQALPGWHGVVCDQADTAAVAREHVRAAGLSERVSAQAADLNLESPGEGYDLVWCSSVLHFLQSPQTALKAICAATRPGGVVVMAHAEVPDDPLLASKVMPFYATMMLRGNYLPRAGEMAQNMAQAGLQQVQSLGRIDFPMAPVWLYTGRRP